MKIAVGGNMKKKIFLTVDSIVIMILIIIGIGYSYYAANIKYMDNQKTVILSDIINLDVEDSQISIDNTSYEKNFTVENISDKDTSFNILLKDITNEYDNNLFYELYEGQDLVVSKSLAPKTADSSYIKLNIKLKAAEKKNYTIKFVSNEAKKFIANLYINSLTINSEIKTATNYILLNNSNITNENGIYYYTTGEYNNVKFNDELYKIVMINKDGNIKIVKDTNIDGNTVFNEDSKKDNANNYASSTLKNTLQAYYNDNIKKYEDMLVIDKYCNDINVVKNDNYKTSEVDKATNEYSENLECSSNNSSYIGLLSYDEAKKTFVASSNYTNTWLVTKAGVNTYTKDNYVWYLNNRGFIDYTKTDNNTLSVRPTVTLKSTLNVTGNGTQQDPYIFFE